MSDEINFVDLMALSKLGPDSVVEKFGGMINSSFFDSSNILGTLKVKGLIDFTTSFPGQSAITITEQGKQLLNEANTKANEPFDQLDFTLLTQLSGGKKTLADLSGAVNLRSRDMALHLYKLLKTQYLNSEFRNGLLDIALTEKGFLQVKAGMPQPQPAAGSQAQQVQGGQPSQQAQAQPSSFAQQAQPFSEAAPASAGVTQSPPQGAQPQDNIEKIIGEARRKKARRNLTLLLVIVLILVVLIALLKMRII